MSAIEAGDAQTLIDRLCQEGVEDGNFFYRFKLNSDAGLSDVFWRDSMMSEDYQIYGDGHEKMKTFQWLFEVFKKSMKMKCRVTIFIDQDLAITSALSNVFPDVRHRLCIWHLYQNAISRFRKLKAWNTTLGFRVFMNLEKSGALHTINCTSLLESSHHRERWRSNEEFDEFECSRAIPGSRLPLIGMIKHASEVYTISVFHDFEDEFLKSISSVVETVGEELEVRAITTTTNLIEDTNVSTSSISVLNPAKATTKGRKKELRGNLRKVERRRTMVKQAQLS
ncbi:hypothetical protein C2S53_014724 [Perilla frutescens var. hirtella]|uniref:MULE transposase domain-containing protein n=1 Tax=Perilla frutescens var. hirtella TaxID=608512 RepID=A0AAD4P526_PERFH|nr:hypothetical protein C2S53_014724 [Perilla frutescens var. hirtella]